VGEYWQATVPSTSARQNESTKNNEKFQNEEEDVGEYWQATAPSTSAKQNESTKNNFDSTIAAIRSTSLETVRVASGDAAGRIPVAGG
jgi:hypothetical protein